ncbi:unnamed protein product [Didymodactylos carnosus]|uniref:Uncharacterized protein n=1 Tax=Didymodactylos carnosus TaxID=1234261 RepID=A0A815DGJ6_9BILA|nr:unnamed protein product [Didymodactylos carnosus]CAF4103200.1 unnamed protein product [Didymodactylos carnosus]
MYSSTSVDKSEVLQFFHGSRYVALEIFTTVYASGVPAFGVSVEIYLLIPYVIVTSILVARKCGSKATTTIAIVWVLKIVFIFIAVEMNHWNFRKYRDYKEKFNTSARALQRQALIFSVSMLFLSAPGLKALYAGVHKSLPFTVSMIQAIVVLLNYMNHYSHTITINV